MHGTRERQGPPIGLLLLIPAAVIIAKGMSDRRGTEGPAWHPGHHMGRFGPPASGERGAFRLPPWIEEALTSWHDRAHRGQGDSEATAA